MYAKWNAQIYFFLFFIFSIWAPAPPINLALTVIKEAKSREVFSPSCGFPRNLLYFEEKPKYFLSNQLLVSDLGIYFNFLGFAGFIWNRKKVN